MYANTMRVSFDPRTATKLGSIDKAIIIGHLSFWINKNFTDKNQDVFRYGHWWTYQTYESMQGYLPFYSIGKLKRLILEMEKDGVLQSAQLCGDKRNKTKWYAILDENVIEWEGVYLDRRKQLETATNTPMVQNWTMDVQNRTMDVRNRPMFKEDGKKKKDNKKNMDPSKTSSSQDPTREGVRVREGGEKSQDELMAEETAMLFAEKNSRPVLRSDVEAILKFVSDKERGYEPADVLRVATYMFLAAEDEESNWKVRFKSLKAFLARFDEICPAIDDYAFFYEERAAQEKKMIYPAYRHQLQDDLSTVRKNPGPHGPDWWFDAERFRCPFHALLLCPEELLPGAPSDLFEIPRGKYREEFYEESGYRDRLALIKGMMKS